MVIGKGFSIIVPEPAGKIRGLNPTNSIKFAVYTVTWGDVRGTSTRPSPGKTVMLWLAAIIVPSALDVRRAGKSLRVRGYTQSMRRIECPIKRLWRRDRGAIDVYCES